jgi:hypothetical protein
MEEQNSRPISRDIGSCTLIPLSVPCHPIVYLTHATYSFSHINSYSILVWTGLGRLEVLEMRVASSAGSNSNSSLVASSSSTPFIHTEKESEYEKGSTTHTPASAAVIGMVVKDKGKKKKEKKNAKEISEKKRIGKSEEENSLDSVFRGKSTYICVDYLFSLFLSLSFSLCGLFCNELEFSRLNLIFVF